MAFNMNRPIIKGTPLHKASIAKAKATEKSIVAPAEAGADASLVEAGYTLGKSYIPGAIDYSIKSPKHKFKKNKKKKVKEEEEIIEETPVSQEDWDNFSEAQAENPDDYRDNKKATPIEPRGYKQPKKKREAEELALPTQPAPDSGKSTDRFVEAAKEFGYDMSTVKGQEEAEATMEYNDATDKWINPKVTVTDPTVTVDSNELAEIKAEQAKELKRISDAKKLKEQNAKIESDKVTTQNKGIKERNKIKQDARDYYGPDVKLTQSKLDAYNEMMRKQQEALDYHPEIVEEDDPEPRKIETQKTKESSSSTPKNNGRQRRLDKKYENAGPSVRANMEADGYIPSKGKSPAEMRDNRIYRNALKDGPVRKNMIKGGYTPE